MLPRLFGNRTPSDKLVRGGTLAENGCGHFCDINTQVLSRLRKKGFTHVWYTGVIRHATTTDYTSVGIPRQHPAVVKGKAGSPYAICDYFDVDPDLASRPQLRMKEFESLVARTHQCGLGVVFDFVPNHLARQYQSIVKPKGITDMGYGDNTSVHFSPQNNFYYYPGQKFSPQFSLHNDEQGDYEEMPAKATGNNCFSASPGMNDWYETAKLNYGIDFTAAGGPQNHFDPIPPTWKKMRRILSYWAEKGIDIFRCDMAEMVPAEFWDYAITAIKREFPNVKFIAEIYNPSNYRRYIESGFDWLYDKVGMYDTLRDVTVGHKGANAITYQWQATDDIRDHMLYFMENHDEQRIASDFFAGDGRRGLPSSAVAMLMSNNPFMMYFGQEFGERGMDEEGFSGRDGRTTIFDYWAIESIQNGFFKRTLLSDQQKELDRTYQRLTQIAANEPAINEGKFFDLMYVNPQSDKFDAQHMYTFLRGCDRQTILVTVNFGSEERSIEVNIPDHAYEILGITPMRSNYATDMFDCHSRPYMPSAHSVRLEMKPYGISVVSLHFVESTIYRHKSQRDAAEAEPK